MPVITEPALGDVSISCVIRHVYHVVLQSEHSDNTLSVNASPVFLCQSCRLTLSFCCSAYVNTATGIDTTFVASALMDSTHWRRRSLHHTWIWRWANVGSSVCDAGPNIGPTSDAHVLFSGRGPSRWRGTYCISIDGTNGGVMAAGPAQYRPAAQGQHFLMDGTTPIEFTEIVMLLCGLHDMR